MRYDYHKGRLIGYKAVRIKPDGSYVSIFDDTTVYRLNKTNRQAAKPEHGGGFYAFPGPLAARVFAQRAQQQGINFGDRHVIVAEDIAILVVECWGTIIHYDGGGKFAATYMKPLAEATTVSKYFRFTGIR